MQYLYSKKIILFLGLIGALQKTDAQNRPLWQKDKKRLTFGIGLGPSYHQLAVDKSPSFLQNSALYAIIPNGVAGFSTQSFTYLRLSPHLYFRTISLVPFFNFSRYQLSIRHYDPKKNIIDNRTRISEVFKIGFPLDLMLRSDRINNFRFYALTGGYFHYNFFTGDDGTVPQGGIIVNFSKVDIGINFGVGCSFYTNYNIISLELRSNIGLNNLLKNDNASGIANALDRLSSRDIYFYVIIH